MGRDFWYYFENPFTNDGKRNYDNEPKKYDLEISISRHNDSIPGDPIKHYTIDTLKEYIEFLTQQYNSGSNNFRDADEAIQIFYRLLAEMIVRRKTDIWTYYG